ncbi:hypothetical protein ABZT08_18060 [Streptomyces sp. NPDC005526]|uniref:hypothetical protein n=1 Tax=Streptomyces sp. NPDC005526 TaxID=3156885 RepID=UPI0033A2DC5B
MSVSRTTVRLIATFVASGALVGAAAMPALAAGSGHDRDSGRGYSQSYRIEHDRHFGDRDRDGDRGRHHDRDRGRHHDRDHDRDWDHRWDRRWNHRWDRDWDRRWDRDWDRRWDRGWHHGWYNDRRWDHDRYPGGR